MAPRLTFTFSKFDISSLRLFLMNSNHKIQTHSVPISNWRKPVTHQLELQNIPSSDYWSGRLSVTASFPPRISALTVQPRQAGTAGTSNDDRHLLPPLWRSQGDDGAAETGAARPAHWVYRLRYAPPL